MGKRRKASARSPSVLALDTSSVCIGWATFADDGELVQHGRFVLPAGAHGEKLAALREWLTKKLSDSTFKDIVIEWPFQGGQRNAYGVLMQYCAIVRMVHWEHYGAEIPDGNRVQASEVKRLLGFKRSLLPKRQRHDDNKRRMVRWANETYGLRLRFVLKDAKKRRSQDDEADAIAVGAAWFLQQQKEQA
jgi:Holliday junction resolvasome RuvABC endonuclease subunit